MSLDSRNFDKGYLKIMQDLLSLLSDRLLKMYLVQASDESLFSRQVLEIYSKLSRLDSARPAFPRLSQSLQGLTSYLVSKHFDSRDLDSAGSSNSVNSRPDSSSPAGIDSAHTAKGYFWLHKSKLEEIEEEDPEKKQELRFHSQPRKDRDSSPTKSNFKYSLARNYNKDDMLGRYNKLTEKFLDSKKAGKDDSLFFSNGIFFHMP